MLRAVVAELAEQGAASGGAVSAGDRREALAAYAARAGLREKRPPRWRHDYARLDFADLHWSSGRMRVPSLPKHLPGASTRDARDDETVDAPALAVENAGGIVHLGSTYLEPADRLGDPRIAVRSLADAARDDAGLSRTIAHHIVPATTDRFTALATAFQNCGASIDIPAGVHLEAPVQMVWASRPGEGSAVFPHVVVRVGEHARATILERHVGTTESFVCGVVEVDLAPGAQLDYVVVQRADEGARVLMHRGVRCGVGARIDWHVAELGGALVRSAITSRLAHAEAHTALNALFFPRGFGHVDLLANLDHLASFTRSATVVRSVAMGRGHGRFQGAIRIAADTHRCDATMRDDALVLSRDAYHEAVPVLDIASADVSAAHGATIGALDEEELFYVQSRGIPRAKAAHMIALAFFEPAIARFPSETLRDEIRTILDTELENVPETFAQ